MICSIHLRYLLGHPVHVIALLEDRYFIVRTLIQTVSLTRLSMPLVWPLGVYIQTNIHTIYIQYFMVLDDAEALLTKNLENAQTNLGHISYDLDYLRDQMTITEVIPN